MNQVISDEDFSTTKHITKQAPVIKGNPNDSFDSVLFYPESEGRKGEGGLRTKGYFKQCVESKPLISIITVVFNGDRFLEDTILSVITQSYDNVEYIIVDGGSTDGTLDIIKKYEGQIDYWVSEKDKGIYDAMNKGIELVSGDWVNFMNAGDRLYDGILESVFTKDVINSFDLVYGGAAVTNEEGTKSIELKPKEFTKFNLLFWTTRTLCNQAMFVRKNIIIPYSIEYYLKGELNWYFDLLENINKYLIVDDVVVYYSLGGVGDVNYKLNSVEIFKVVFSRFGVYGLLTVPVVLYKLFKRV